MRKPSFGLINFTQHLPFHMVLLALFLTAFPARTQPSPLRLCIPAWMLISLRTPDRILAFIRNGVRLALPFSRRERPVRTGSMVLP